MGIGQEKSRKYGKYSQRVKGGGLTALLTFSSKVWGQTTTAAMLVLFLIYIVLCIFAAPVALALLESDVFFIGLKLLLISYYCFIFNYYFYLF